MDQKPLSQQTRPAVDVGVVTWNTRDLTVEALRRLLDSDQGADIKLYVRDNGSTDGTPDAIRAQVPEADLEVGENVGFGAGTNTLIARSSSPWFFALNSDAWPEPGAIGRMIEVAEAHPAAGVVAPRLETPDGRLEFSTHPFPSPRVAAVVNLGLHRFLSPERKAALTLDGWWRHDAERVVDWAVGAALLFPRRVLDEVGGFDERFFMYAEDLELGWRLHQRGYETVFTPRAVVRHVHNASGEQAYGHGRTAAYLRNTHAFYRDAGGPVNAALYRALEAMGSAGQWFKHRRRGERDEAGAWKERVKVHVRGK